MGNDLNRKSIHMELAEVMRRLYEKGYLSSAGGNASCRKGGIVYITPSGRTKFLLTEEDISEVDIEGNVLNGNRPSSELPVHLSIYNARQDINCVIHAHPAFTVVLSMVTGGDFFESARVTPESAAYIGRVKVIDYKTPGVKAAKSVEEVIKDADVVVIRNHGVFSTGRTLEEAYTRLEVLEENSKIIYYLYLALRGEGSPELMLKRFLLSDDQIRELIDQYKK